MIVLTDFLYNALVVPIMRLVMFLLAFNSEKAQIRRRVVKGYQDDIASLDPDKPRFWVHSASMGEFEQIIPILSHLKSIQPTVQIVASFYSPSGYNAGKNCPHVDSAFILPNDTRTNMSSLVTRLRPSALLFARYDLWRNLVLSVSKTGVPISVVNASFPTLANTCFMNRWVRDTYNRCATIWAVSPKDLEQFSSSMKLNDDGRYTTLLHLPNTRIDRVVQSRSQYSSVVEQLSNRTTTTIVLGSIWPKDITLFNQIPDRFNKSIRWIVVPHDPSESLVEQACAIFSAKKFSAGGFSNSDNIVVDSVGMLLALYGIANAAYIGGGFGVGVHSVLEPAGQFIPVATGPNISRSSEARDMLEIGVLSIVTDSSDITNWINQIVLNETETKRVSTVAQEYFSKNSGTAATIVSAISNSIAH